jgi:uncharacterized repeat protein (TIGR03803 family)
MFSTLIPPKTPAPGIEFPWPISHGPGPRSTTSQSIEENVMRTHNSERPIRIAFFVTRWGRKRQAILLTVLILAATAALGQNETVLYTFQGGSDGRQPMAGLISDQSGNLYGTTYYGGGSANCAGGCGTVFELSPPSAPGGNWSESVLYAFQGGTDGVFPQAALIFDSAGNLYGTTFGGSNTGCLGYGCGTVFELSPPSAPRLAWTETILHHFQGSGDGSNPAASLIFDAAGNLYGTASAGGKLERCEGEGCGTVFELSPPSAPGGSWTYSVLLTFGGSKGAFPVSALIFDSQGNLYGTTEYGDTHDTQFGTVFQLAPPAAPSGAWIETLLYAFDGYSGGKWPLAGLVFDQKGNLYGTTFGGGTSYSGICRNDEGCGVVFELSPPSVSGDPWTETVLASFRPVYGAQPAAPVVFDDLGNLYGTTRYDGESYEYGSAFELMPPAAPGGAWTGTILHVFKSGTDGATPYSPLLMGTGGAFYGTTEAGGTANDGTVYALVLAPIAIFSPTNLSFGNETVNFTSSPQKVTLTNNGNSALTITNVQVTGSNYTDFAQTNNCSQPIPPTKSCQFQVTFTPSETGTRSAALTITDNAQNGQQSLPLTGVGVLPAVTFKPTSLTFPPQLVFTKSAPQKVTLTNSGLGILAISNINLTGSSFRQTNTCGNNQIASGASCTFSVTFLPTLKGQFTGSVSVTDNAPASPQSFALSGTGTVILVNPTSLDFGTQPLGTSSLPLTVTLSNKGHQAVTIEKIGIVGSAAGDFSEINTCGDSLASGASCFIYVTFTPSEKGYRKATLGIRDNGGGSPQEVSLEGYGT